MAAFDATTAYAEDWRYLDGVSQETITPRDSLGADATPTRTVQVKQGGDVTEPDFQAFAQSLGLTPRDGLFTVWQDDDDPLPEVGDKLTVLGADWSIIGVSEVRWGPAFQCACRREL